MDEECQKTKEGERMKTKKSRSGWKNRGGEGLKKDPDLVADGGGGSRRGQCTQTRTAGTCSQGNIKCYKGGGGDNASTHESRLAPGPEVSSILYETSVTPQYYRECASVRQRVHFAKPPWKAPVPPGAGSAGPADCCLTGYFGLQTR